MICSSHETMYSLFDWREGRTRLLFPLSINRASIESSVADSVVPASTFLIRELLCEPLEVLEADFRSRSTEHFESCLLSRLLFLRLSRVFTLSDDGEGEWLPGLLHCLTSTGLVSGRVVTFGLGGDSSGVLV